MNILFFKETKYVFSFLFSLTQHTYIILIYYRVFDKLFLMWAIWPLFIMKNLVWPIGSFLHLEISQHQIIIILFICIYCMLHVYVIQCFYIDWWFCSSTCRIYMLRCYWIQKDGNPTMMNSHRVDTNPRFNTEGFIFLQITFFKTKFFVSIMSYTGLHMVQKHDRDINYFSFFIFLLTNKLV